MKKNQIALPIDKINSSSMFSYGNKKIPDNFASGIYLVFLRISFQILIRAAVAAIEKFALSQLSHLSG